MGSDEVTKLVRRGEGWLADHPRRDLIVDRYLLARHDYVEDAAARLEVLDDSAPEETEDTEEETSTP